MLDLTILAAAAEAAHGAAEHHEAPTAWLLTPGGWVAASMLFVFALMLWRSEHGPNAHGLERAKVS